jgi:uncharacterized protein (TIGR02444 family)
MTADWPASPFWDFSLRVYSQPEVERCCLTLQDEHGLDVNLVLLATWAAGTGRALDPTLAARLRQIGDDYQATVMRPLREARRALKSQRVTPALSPILAERRRLLLALELDLERLEQVQLEALTSPVSSDAEAAGDALLEANLRALYPNSRSRRRRSPSWLPSCPPTSRTGSECRCRNNSLRTKPAVEMTCWRRKAEEHTRLMDARNRFLLNPSTTLPYTRSPSRPPREGFQTMSLHEHVDSLRAKHARLEQQIDEEQHRPMPDSIILVKLKREKLRLKEAIERLQDDSDMETSRRSVVLN